MARRTSGVLVMAGLALAAAATSAHAQGSAGQHEEVHGVIAVAEASSLKPANRGEFDRGDNAMWLRRHWMHEGPTNDEIADLVASLRARGIRRIYPFLGPMDRDGWPGWRSKSGLRRYDPERAGAFLAEIKRIAPDIRVMPWTGGNLRQDVRLEDLNQRRGFVEHARRLVALGADGVHLNVEPLPSFTPGFRELLREVKAAIGDKTLSISAYPPPTELHPFPDVHWELPFLRDVCNDADELAVMGYDTAVTSQPVFRDLVTRWMGELIATLASPPAGSCEWLMGVPTYDDDKPYHRPDVETIDTSLAGIIAALRTHGRPDYFRGVAIYASFTTDGRKWALYDRLWRGVEPVTSPLPDPRNTTE